MRNANMPQFKLAAVLLCVLAASATLQAAEPARRATAPVAIDSIAVIVNEDVITRNELTERVKTIMQRMKAQNVALPDPADLRRQILERMIV